MAAMTAPASAQVNGKGVVQLGFGLDLGVHTTHYEGTFHYLGLSYTDGNDDNAATVTFPIEAQYGLSDRFSLGLYLEPGQYVDSAGTHPNHIFLFGISPRYYLVNKDRFALYIHADVGGSTLRITDVEDGNKLYDDTYSGWHFRPGAEVQWYFGNTFGIHLGVDYAANWFNWRSRSPDDPVLDLFGYSAKLNTSGVQFRLGLQVKL